MADCIFDRIARGEIPSTVVYQDDTVMAFRDIHPKAPVHVLIIPKKHITSMMEMTKEDVPIIGHMMEVASLVGRQEGLNAYKLVINNGKAAGQEVMHLHMHLLGGKHNTELV
jgi:histidine triad (HIT) family protein